MGGILVFRERAAEIKKNAFYAVRRDIFRQIFRCALYKIEVINSGCFCRLARRDYNIRVLFNGDNIGFGISFCKFHRKAALTAAYFENVRRGSAEELIKIDIFGIACRIIEVSVLKVAYKKQL